MRHRLSFVPERLKLIRTGVKLRHERLRLRRLRLSLTRARMSFTRACMSLTRARMSLTPARMKLTDVIAPLSPMRSSERSRKVKVIAGGQTGADRGGLDAAIELGLVHGGFCPRGRRAEDGKIPDRYRLEELGSPRYEVRTERNVLEAEATVVFTFGEPEGGSALTLELAERLGRPSLAIDLDTFDDGAAARKLRDFLRKGAFRVLNVAGSRESRSPGIAARVKSIVMHALRPRAERSRRT